MSSGNGSIAASQYAKAVNSKPPGMVFKTRYGITSDKYGAKKAKKEKKMGWFRKKFNNWVRQAWEDARTETVDRDVIRAHDGINGKSSVRFTVYPASGGFVIESYKQDRYKENDGPELTIVNHGDELGKAVEHIIAIEALRS